MIPAALRPCCDFLRRHLRSAAKLGAFVALGAVPGAGLSAGAEVCVIGDGRIVQQVCYFDAPGAPVYGHEVLGDTPEWDALRVEFGPDHARIGASSAQVVLRQEQHVFEDIQPRLVDLDGDRIPEIITVQSSFAQGARLVVYGLRGGLSQIAATPYIGRSYRWLAPVGAADLDGDGAIEIGYVDRPHLAKTLRIWRFKDGALRQVATKQGLTNHRIGEAFISGGIRDCGAGPEVVTVDGQWKQLLATRLENGRLRSEPIGQFTGQASISEAMACR